METNGIFKKSHDWNTEDGSKFWLKEVEEFGKNSYVTGVLSIINSYHPQTAFELSLGTGFPFAASLLEQGVEMHGCDISLPMLQALQKKYPQIHALQSGYEQLVQIAGSDRFDCTYCLRSSWYFSDVVKAIAQMIAITKPNGVVIFDIMNADSPKIKSGIREALYKKWRLLAKNAIKFVLNPFRKRKFIYERASFLKDYPVSPQKIDAFLQEKKIVFKKLTFDQVSGTATEFDPNSFRILYIVEKK